jgi:hypothetical protein
LNEKRELCGYVKGFGTITITLALKLAKGFNYIKKSNGLFIFTNIASEK